MQNERIVRFLEVRGTNRAVQGAATKSWAVIRALCSLISPVALGGSVVLFADNLAFGLEGQEGEASFQLSTTIHYHYYDNGEEVFSQTNQLEVTCSAGVLKITSPGTPSPVGVPVESYTYVSDGRETYFIARFRETDSDRNSVRLPDGKRASLVGGKLAITSAADVSIRDDVVPPNHVASIGIAWLAYSCFTTAEPEAAGRSFPVAFMGPEWPTYSSSSLEAVWQRSVQEPFFLQRLEEYADSGVFEHLQRLRAKFGTAALPDAYRDGFTNAVYQVVAWTNCGDMHIPTSFKLTRFAPRAGGTRSADLVTQLSYTGTLTSLSVAEVFKTAMPSSFPKNTQVSDYRGVARGSPPRRYTSQDGRMLTLEEVANLKKPEPLSARSRVLITRALVAASVFVPVILLSIILIRKRRLGNGSDG